MSMSCLHMLVSRQWSLEPIWPPRIDLMATFLPSIFQWPTWPYVHTVDGQNPAPVDLWFITFSKGFYMHQSINSTLQIEMLNNIAMVEKRGQKETTLAPHVRNLWTGSRNYTHGLRETHRILPTRSQRDHGWPLLSSFHGGACGKRSCSRTLGHHTSFYKRQSSLGLCGDLAKQALEDSRGDYRVLKLFYWTKLWGHQETYQEGMITNHHSAKLHTDAFIVGPWLSIICVR